MKKIKLAKDLYQYQFPPTGDQHFGFNIYALINGNEALLIDTAFEQHSKAVLQDLEQAGIKITKVVFSHFHPDHISGLPALKSPQLYASKRYQLSLDKYTAQDKHHYFDGVNKLTQGAELIFGPFHLQFHLVQGHVICGLFTVINDRFIHVADDIMATNEGKAILPSVHASNAKAHVDSLALLKNYVSHTLLLSHGNALSGESEILTAVKQRQNYLHAIASSNEPISIAKALKDNEGDFLHQEWHDYVYL